MELWLVRHAQSIWNAEERWQGQSDTPLSEAGRIEAAQVGARLAEVAFDRMVSSDLSRAMDTARAIAGARTIESWPALREMNLGAWCGLPHAEVMAREPEALRALAHGEDVRLGGHGETLSEFSARVHAGLDALIGSSAPDARVLAVAHGGVVRAVMLGLLGLAGRHRPLSGASNTALTVLRIDGRARRLAVYNDAAHVPDARPPFAPREGAPEERVVRGAAGREAALEALALAPAAPLEAPLEDTETRVLLPRGGKGGVLVAYGARPRGGGSPPPGERIATRPAGAS